MESLTRSLNYELPHDIQFDKYAQHILENSHTPALEDSASIALASTPSITTLATVPQHLTATDFLKKLGASFINSIQLHTFPKSNPLESASIPAVSIQHDSSSVPSINMDLDFTPNHLIMDSRNYNSAMDELQKQLEYDKFMNEVWIGIVLTLILISMIFCFCSCFLYHQFRMWKRNYRTTVTQSSDVESCKFNLDLEDPVPEYTLVSGLPSYEAALELLHKNPNSCLIVHPTVFEVFNRNEKSTNQDMPEASSSSLSDSAETQTLMESSMPLLGEVNADNKLASYVVATLPTYQEATSTASTPTSPITPSLPYNHSLASILTLTPQKSQSQKNKSNPSTPTAECSQKQLKS